MEMKVAVQFTEIGGRKVAVIPLADYERLVGELEDRADHRAAIDAEQRRRDGEEYLPAAMVDRLLAGDSRLRTWRRHRGLTLRQLAERSGASSPYLSELESGKYQGRPDLWRRLAVTLDVAIEDILPEPAA